MVLLRPRLIAAGVVLCLAFLVGWTVQGWRMQSILDRKELAHAKQLEAMHAKALADYRQMEIAKNDAIKQAESRAAANALAATTARATADRLRGDLAGVPARISAASCGDATTPSMPDACASFARFKT